MDKIARVGPPEIGIIACIFRNPYDRADTAGPVAMI
jgi:hypothetical protein